MSRFVITWQKRRGKDWTNQKPIILSYLQDCEVLEHAVHHVLLGKALQLVDEVDHVLAHGASVELVDEATSLELGILRLHLLHHLLAKAAHFGRTLDRHVLCALVSERIQL